MENGVEKHQHHRNWLEGIKGKKAALQSSHLSCSHMKNIMVFIFYILSKHPSYVLMLVFQERSP